MTWLTRLSGVAVSWWQLFLFIFFVWTLGAAAAIARVKVKNAIEPLPSGPRGDSSCATVPFVAIVLWSAAKLIDGIVGPWGTNVAIAIHLVFALIFLFDLVRQRMRLRRVRRESERITAQGTRAAEK